MKKAAKLACFVLVVLILTATAACAANITFSNSLNLRIAITMTYVDRDLGVLVTKGWWHVEPGGETVVSLNADESYDIYYAAYNKDQYFDSSTRSNPQIKRWANRRIFTYTTDEEPYDDDVWYGRFYRINGRSVNIDE